MSPPEHERCACGAAVPPSATWCPLCHEPVVRARPAPTETRPGEALPGVLRYHPRFSDRWARTEITYGPVGRVVATILWSLPIVLFLPQGLVGLLGICIYMVIYPRGMKQIWARVPRRDLARRQP
jgi:hypothetical protein